MPDLKIPTLEDAMIAAGIPIATDGNGQLLVKQTRDLLASQGLFPVNRFDGSWRVQKLQGRCFAFDGSSCPSGATCVFGPDTRSACEQYISDTCNAQGIC